MRVRTICILAGVLLAFAAGLVSAQDTEQDIVNRYLQKTEKKHTHKLGWASLYFGADRINRDNDYNRFANVHSAEFTDGSLNWLEQGYALGADFGLFVTSRMAWNFGGEYWLKQGTNLSGDFEYTPSGGPTMTVTDPSSEVAVYGVYTGAQYYLLNPPQKTELLQGLALRVGGTVGYYATSWDLWPEYQNLNLATSAPETGNTAYKGSAPGFSLDMGVDFPMNFWNLSLGLDASYFYLNFNNVAWYNSQDEEIVATWSPGEDGRVDLDFTGIRGKLQIKRFFSW